MKSDKEFLEEIQAQEGLIARGYTRDKCLACKGTGRQEKWVHEENQPKFPVLIPCLTCEGKGFKWKVPLMR